jgi:polysaccharide deacetylase 2 family uncharacterized protein YibQ
VNAVNDAPVNAVPLEVQTIPNGGLEPFVLSSQYGNGVSISDSDAGVSVVQVTLTATNGTMSLYLPYASGVTFVTGDGTLDTTMSMTGTIANINAALSWLNFYATPNHGTTATSASLAIVTDDFGNTGAGGSQTDADTVSFSVAPYMNAAPVNAVPLTVQTIPNGGLEPFVLSSQYGNGVSISDSDAGVSVVQVTLTATNGTMSLYLPYASGVTFVTGDGTLDSTMSMTGTVANINAALSWLNFYATPNYGTTATSASLAIVTDDLGNTGVGGSQTDADTVSFSVAPYMNAAPVNTVPLPVQTISNGGLAPFVLSSQYENGISVYDPDAGANVVQVTLTATNGTMSLYLPYASGVTFVTGDGTLDTTMSMTGTVSNINAALSWLNFYATPNYGTTATSASLAIVTDDLGNTGAGGSQTDADTVSFTVEPALVNDAPVNTVPLTVQTIPNGGVQPFVLSSQYENGISIYDPDAGTNVVQVTLTATNGTMSLYLPYASGVTFLTGDGTLDTTMSMTGTVSNINAALSWLNFYATPNYSTSATSASLAIVTDDLGSTGVGGSQTDTDTVSFTVEPALVNDAPVNTVPLTVQTIPNGGVQPFVLSSQYENGVSIYDPDAGANVVQVTLTATNGTMSLYLPYASGVTFVAGDGTLDTTMSMTGTIANINAALSWLNFYATPNYGTTATSASLAIVTDDLGNTGAGGSQTDTDTVSFSVAPYVNAAPVNTVPLPVQTIPNGGVQPFVLSSQYENGISIYDPDAGANVVQVTLTATNGTMSVYLPYASGVTFVAGDGTLDTTMSMTGTIANINAALSWLNFYATPNHGTTATSASLAIVTDDLGNTGVGGSQTDTDSVSFTIQPIVWASCRLYGSLS